MSEPSELERLRALHRQDRRRHPRAAERARQARARHRHAEERARPIVPSARRRSSRASRSAIPGRLSGETRRACSSAKSCRLASRSSAPSPSPISDRKGTFSERAAVKHFGMAAVKLPVRFDRRSVPRRRVGRRRFRRGAGREFHRGRRGPLARPHAAIADEGVRRSGRAHPSLPDVDVAAARAGRDPARVLPRPVARAMPRVAEREPAAGRARRRVEQRGGRAPRRRTSRVPPPSRARPRPSTTALRSSPPTSRTSPTTRRAS